MELRKSKLTVPPFIKSRLSMPMQQLFDLVIMMVAKDEEDRIDFDEVYKFIAEQESFVKLSNAQRKSE